MAGEVTSITVTEQTLYNLTIEEDDSKVVTVTVPDEIATIEINAYDVNINIDNLGDGIGVFKAQSVDNFLFRSITDDDKTIDTSLQNSDNDIRIKLPDAGISTPDGFTINADSDSSAKIELPGSTVDLSKAKLLTELDANGQEINDILNATATDSFIGDLRGAVKFRAKAGEDLSKGEAVYISDISGNTPVVSLAKADSATTMPAYGLVFADANENANVQIIEFGDLKGLDTATDSLELDKPVYVSATTAGGITATRPTDATHLVQNIGLVNRVHASAGAIKVGGSGRVNDVPNQFSITGDITTTAGTITAPTGDITTVNSTTGNITTVNATDVNSTTGDITTVNSTNVNSTNLDVDTGTIDDLTSTTVDINGGSIDGATVGATTSSTGRFSTLASDSVDLNGGAIDGTTIGATTPVAGTFTTATATTGDITTVNSTTGNITTVNATDVNVSDDLVVTDDASVGGDLAVTGNTVLTGNLTVNGTTTTVNTETINLADNNIVLNSNETGTPSQDGGITIERGTSDDAVFQWTESTDKWEAKVGSSYADLKVADVNTTSLTATTGDITNMNSTNVNIDGGAIDGTPIGANTPSTIVTTNLTATTADINAGTIDNSVIGGSTPVAGTFTTLGATTGNITTVNSTDVNSTNLDVDVGDIATFNTASLTATSANIGTLGALAELDITTSITVDDGSTGQYDIDTLTITPTGITIYDSGNGTSVPQSTLTLSAQTVNTPLLTVGSANGYEDPTIGTTTAPTWGSSGTYPFWNLYGGANIGSVTKPFAQLHIASIYGNRTASGISGIGLQNSLIPLKTDVSNGTSGDIHLGGSGSDQYFDKAYIDQLARTLKTQSLEPLTDRTYDLGNTGGGASTKYFANGYFDHLETQSLKAPDTSDGGDLGSEIEIIGHLIPDSDNTRTLGSASKQWKEVFIGPGSLYIDGHKVLGSDAAGQIDITTDDDQSLNITAGAAGTSGDITISSAGNTTSIDDTTIHLGPQNNSGTVNAHGTLEAPDLHVGDLEFSANKIDNTTSNGNLEIATNGTGYLHLNSADVYVGPVDGAIKLDESSITVSNTDGNLNLAGNGTGLVNINSQSLITDSAGGLTAPILELETDNSGWNRPALMLKDSNGDAVSIVGEHNTTFDYYALNYTLDPNNTNGDTSTTNFAGDYYVAFSKNYSNPSSVGMNMDIYGANDGFNLTARGDFGAYSTRYSAKPIRIKGQKVELYSSDDTTPFGNFTERLVVDEERSKFSNVVKLNNASSDPSGENGDMYYNTTTNKFRGYQNGAWINLDGS